MTSLRTHLRLTADRTVDLVRVFAAVAIVVALVVMRRVAS
jgi:hypothetical protein